MPDRRINGSSNIEAANWPTAGPPKPTSAPLRIISGRIGNLPAGESMSAIVQSAGSGAFKVTLNGQALTFTGLPPSLNGKQVDFVVQHGKSGGKAMSRLFWTGISRSGDRALAVGKQAHIHAPLHVDLKTDSGITTRLQGVSQTLTTENCNLANMQPGETALAIVERLLGNGRVQLSLKGNRMDTPAPSSIAVGDGLIVKMTGEPASLQVLSVQQHVISKAYALLRQQAADNTPLTDNLTAVRNLLTSIPVESLRGVPILAQLENWLNNATVGHDTPLSGLRLAGMMQQSGLLLEHKLLAMLQQNAGATAIAHDLKAIMLAMAAGQADNDKLRHLAHVFATIGHSALSRIESTQMLNVLAHSHADAMRMELPMLVHQQMVNVQLSLEQQEQGHRNAGGKDGRNEQAAYKVLIALDMSRLGSLRVDASISDNAVHARIYHKRAEARDLMQSHIDRLEERLLNLGFKTVYLVTTPAQPEQKIQQHFEQLEQRKPASPGLLDILV